MASWIEVLLVKFSRQWRSTKKSRRKENEPVGVVHLVKLVNHANSLVGKHQSSTFEGPLSRHGVLPNTRRQSNSTGSLTSGENGPVRRLLNVLEELRFRSSGISKQQDVDVSTNSMLSVDVF